MLLSEPHAFLQGKQLPGSCVSRAVGHLRLSFPHQGQGSAQGVSSPTGIQINTLIGCWSSRHYVEPRGGCAAGEQAPGVGYPGPWVGGQGWREATEVAAGLCQPRGAGNLFTCEKRASQAGEAGSKEATWCPRDGEEEILSSSNRGSVRHSFASRGM